MSGRLSWEGKALQLSAIHWDWWFYVKLGVFNLAHGFFKHCCHMLFVEVHLMKLLFPFRWAIIMTKQNDTWYFHYSDLLLGRFHTNGHNSPHITDQYWENGPRKVRPPAKFLLSVSLKCGKLYTTWGSCNICFLSHLCSVTKKLMFTLLWSCCSGIPVDPLDTQVFDPNWKTKYYMG